MTLRHPFGVRAVVTSSISAISVLGMTWDPESGTTLLENGYFSLSHRVLGSDSGRYLT